MNKKFKNIENDEEFKNFKLEDYLPSMNRRESKADTSVLEQEAATEEIKSLLAWQWVSYAQVSILTLQQLDDIRKSQKEQGEQQELQPQEHIHKHTFDIKSSKVFSLVVGLGVVCALSQWGNIEQWQSKRQYTDDALKFRAIRSWGGCTAENILCLNKVFDIHQDKKAIEWIRKQADGYDTSLKTVSDSQMQESIKSKYD